MILYHITPVDRLPSIFCSGLLPEQKRELSGFGVHKIRPIWLTPFPSYVITKMGLRTRNPHAVLSVDITNKEVLDYGLFAHRNFEYPFQRTDCEFVTFNRIEPSRLRTIYTYNPTGT